ncbi:MAG: lipoate--protein ligase family protein [Candidatus Delongbacteria bacterium]|nr:lipoate--protein ligase family protein [Candidatus Delongbacteria bacterium]MCG2761537.1 lipoate--protein ligase family protein [Candidatus Delongbacteria bacterium]
MSGSGIRFLDTGSNHGKFNMAADYYIARNLLDKPVFRVYRWEPYCISLGYHQDLNEINGDKCRELGYDIVRRETGGRAVFHSEELTYSMIIPKNSKLYSDSILEVYNKISQVLVTALKAAGVFHADLKKGKSPDFKELYKEKLSSICFSSTSAYEVVIGDKKLVGSAQKRLKDSVLQHGSIIVGEKHLELIDLLKIEDRLKDRYRDITKSKTATIGEVLELSDHESFYSTLKIELKKALVSEFDEKIDDFSLSEKDLLEINGIESYFNL